MVIMALILALAVVIWRLRKATALLRENTAWADDEDLIERTDRFLNWPFGET